MGGQRLWISNEIPWEICERLAGGAGPRRSVRVKVCVPCMSKTTKTPRASTFSRENLPKYIKKKKKILQKQHKKIGKNSNDYIIVNTFLILFIFSFLYTGYKDIYKTKVI